MLQDLPLFPLSHGYLTRYLFSNHPEQVSDLITGPRVPCQTASIERYGKIWFNLC